MTFLEIIRLRSAAYPMETLSNQITASIQSNNEQDGETTVTVFRRAGLETDLAIHIHRPSDPGTAAPSDLGLRLADALKAYGLVEHTVWETKKQQ